MPKETLERKRHEDPEELRDESQALAVIPKGENKGEALERRKEQSPEKRRESKEKPLTPEEETERLQRDITETKTKLGEANVKIEQLKKQLQDVREALGHPQEGQANSVAAYEVEQKRLMARIAELNKRQQEMKIRLLRDRILQEERARILKERLEKLFAEFEKIDNEEVGIMQKTGKMRNERRMRSEAFGRIEPEFLAIFLKLYKMKFRPEDIRDEMMRGEEELGDEVETSEEFYEMVNEAVRDEAEEKAADRMKSEKPKEQEDEVLEAEYVRGPGDQLQLEGQKQLEGLPEQRQLEGGQDQIEGGVQRQQLTGEILEEKRERQDDVIDAEIVNETPSRPRLVPAPERQQLNPAPPEVEQAAEEEGQKAA